MENSGNNLINFVSSEVAEEERESSRLRYQRNLKTSMRGSDFIFDSVQLI